MNGLRFSVAPLIAAAIAGMAIRFSLPDTPWLFALGGAVIVGLSVLAGLLVVGLRRAREHDAQRTRELNALAHVELALASCTDSAEALARALDVILEFSHAAAAQLWHISEHDARLVPAMHRGLFPESFNALPVIPERVTFHSALDDAPALASKGFVERVQIPLAAYNHPVGVLEIAARYHGELARITYEWFETVGRALAAALADARELTRVRAQLADEKRLWQAGLDVTATENYEELLRTIVDRARELIGAEASALCLWDEQKRWWVVQGTSGATDAFEVSVAHFERGDGQFLECPVIRFKYRQAHLDFPLQRNGQIVGCLCVANRTPREYLDSERALLTGIADQAALAVERTRAFETLGSRAATAERERLAREIHDTLAQILGFVNVKTATAREFLAQGKLEQAETQLDQLSLLSQELYQDTRELILGLRTEVGPERGLVPALSSYVERFSQFCNLPTTFDADGVEVNFSPAVEVQLIRVVQEALSNVRKHAHAQHAWVRMTRRAEIVQIEIGDDGQGFDPANPGRGLGPRFGLQSMRERVESIHGTLKLRSVPGQGTTVTVEIPLIYRGERT
ncbi:MAG: GAF domain-containing sensor histidine kinase [Chloroflexi bacterium]|nr:GAF domain-containing sensor histidine kinase [Chloroflexota bacterium]